MPNGEDKRLGFVAKVRDKTGVFKPIYIAPDATDSVQGDVKLSDATNSTLGAANGMTAATPAAVKAVQDNANNKLDKTTGSDQTVASAVTFNNGITVPSGKFFIGSLQGNADTATTLKTPRTISLAGDVTGSTTFDGSGNVSINASIAAQSVTSEDVSFNYAGSSSKGGAATSALKLDTARTITVSGDASGTVSFDGSDDATLELSVNKLSAAQNITLTGEVTGTAAFDGSAEASIAATIANGAVEYGNLAAEIGTVVVSEEQPVDSHVQIWIKP